MTRIRTAPGTAGRRPLVLPLLLVGVLLAALAACGPGSSSSESASGSSGATAADAVAPEPAPGSEDAASPTSTLRDAAVQDSLQRAVVATGELRVETRDVERARDEALRRVQGWGGLVADEQTRSDDRGRPRASTMVLRVPTPRFDDALAALADLGRVTEQTRSAEDVTTQVVDTDARVRAAERSIRSIEALLSRAERLGEVIRIESDLARRQADLDSLKSQQAYLADQTSLSTVTLHLERPVVAGPAQDEARGFVAGLQQGWAALSRSGVALTTVVGAVLPFAVLLALLTTPVALVLRRRRSHGTVTAPSASGAPAA